MYRLWNETFGFIFKERKHLEDLKGRTILVRIDTCTIVRIYTYILDVMSSFEVGGNVLESLCVGSCV